MLDKLLTVLFPRHCVGCHERGNYLCEDCRGKVERACTPDIEFADREKNPRLVQPLALYSYHEPLVRTLIKMLKYKSTRDVVSTIAPLMYDELIEELADEQLFNGSSPIYIIPIPISRDRLKLRGYNQAEELAKVIVRLSGHKFKLANNILKKTRSTASQVSVRDRGKRLRNVKNSFVLTDKTDDLKASTVVLIDDVITTGATMSEAIRLITPLGVKKIFCLCFAHG